MAEPKGRGKITDETEVSTTELAVILGVSARRVQQLTQDGILPTARRGWYLLGDSVQRFIRFSSTPRLSKEEQEEEKNRRKADATIKTSKAAILAMEVRELSGSMHRAEDVAAMTEDLIYTFRSGILALPGRLAVDTAAADTPAEAAEIIKREVHQLMRELSRYHYDPKKYEERVRERRKWDDRNDDGD